MWRTIPPLIALAVIAAAFYAVPSPASDSSPGRTMELVEGHGLRCVLVYNGESAMAAPGSTAVWCSPNRAGAAGPFRVIGR